MHEAQRRLPTGSRLRSLTLSGLSELLGVSPGRVVETAFHDLGWMVTVPEKLPWERVEAVARELGFVARRGPDYPVEEELD